MSQTLLLTLLFLGNVVLFYLWVNSIVRVLKGQCPHCAQKHGRSGLSGLWAALEDPQIAEARKKLEADALAAQARRMDGSKT